MTQPERAGTFSAMRNITGNPAEGDDYFERSRELRRLLNELDHGSNLRINAPRRVGKTSLVLRLCREWTDKAGKAVFLNVEDAADELSFAESRGKYAFRSFLLRDSWHRRFVA